MVDLLHLSRPFRHTNLHVSSENLSVMVYKAYSVFMPRHQEGCTNLACFSTLSRQIRHDQGKCSKPRFYYSCNSVVENAKYP